MLYSGDWNLHVRPRRIDVCVLKYHSFRETPEVRWLVKDIRASRQVVENGRRLFQIKIAEQTVRRMLQRLDAIKLIDKQRKLQHIPLIQRRLDGLKVQQLTQCKHRPRFVVHVNLPSACSNCLTLSEAPSEECSEDFACAGENAGIDLKSELRVVSILDNEHDVAEFAQILACGLEKLDDGWQDIVCVLQCAGCGIA
jgi:hypothetical protein